jgi:hypothetical protein
LSGVTAHASSSGSGTSASGTAGIAAHACDATDATGTCVTAHACCSARREPVKATVEQAATEEGEAHQTEKTKILHHSS